MSQAMGDPDLAILYWAEGNPGRWVDENGWPLEVPADSAGRVVTEVRSDGRRRAAIVHSADLAGEREVLGAACSYSLTALENERLVGELNESLLELSQSRARVIAVADNEHKKIERDLHDGAQQRLVAVRVKLGLLAERATAESPPMAESIHRIEDDVEAAIDEVRSFAHGIYPALLSDRGLSEALRAAGRAAPVPTIVDAAGLSRYPRDVEATIYFSCIEALQNAAKHARGLSGVVLSVHENGALTFTVSDDGAGFDSSTVTEGTGLTNLRDRMAAIGGTLEISSTPGRGTRVTGSVSSSSRRVTLPSERWVAP
jgi:signal transduction histidine kinase